MCFTMAGGRPLHCPVEEKVEIVKIYYSCGENAETTRRTLYQNGVELKKWDKIGMDRAPIPSGRAIREVIGVFNETGYVDRKLLKRASLQMEDLLNKHVKNCIFVILLFLLLVLF